MLNKTRIEIERLVLEYIQKELENNSVPSYKALNKLFKIQQNKIRLSDIYSKLGFDILNFPVKRPHRSYPLLKEKLVDYVKTEISKGHYPSRRELENKFRVRLSGLFDGIEDLYLKAGSKYIQKSSQKLKQTKAKILLNITLDNILPKLNLIPIRYSKIQQHGVDIISKDINNKIILIELKAYNKFEPLKEKDINQVKRFLKQNKSEKAIIITTTQKIQKTFIIPSKIRVIFFDELTKLVDIKYQKQLKFIRSFSIHREINEIEIKKKKIIQYVKERHLAGKDFSYKSILKDLHTDMRGCFSSIYEIYKEAGIPVPPKKIKGIRAKKQDHTTTELKKRILQYIKEQLEKGHYPSGVEIGRKFGISHIWNFVKVSEIYHELGLPAYHERKGRKVIISSPLP